MRRLCIAQPLPVHGYALPTNHGEGRKGVKIEGIKIKERKNGGEFTGCTIICPVGTISRATEQSADEWNTASVW
jgi:hypothetical protein